MANFSGAVTAINSIESTSMVPSGSVSEITNVNRSVISSNVIRSNNIVINKRPTSGMTFPRIIK